jgi:hypothetical protein
MKTIAAMPVVDNVAIANIVLMLDELEAQYDKMTLQLKEAEKHSGFLSGKNAFSDLHNTTVDKQAREWAPDTIEAFEDMIASGFNPGDLADRYAYYQTKFPALSYEYIEPKNPNSSQRNLYAYNEEWTKMNLVSFAQTFDTVNESYERINNLLSEVNEHDTLKESSDFSNRLLGELAYLLQQLIQVQNFEMHVNTMLQQADQNYIAAHADFFTFEKK